jgi:hypothetical protein
MSMAQHILLHRPGRPIRVLLFGLVTLTLLWGSAGCTRRFFRRRADKQVDELYAEKDTEPAWKLEQANVYPDPRSRFADWTNPDRPPMPPDDPWTYDLSPRPQRPGKAGVQYIEGTLYYDILQKWDEENRARIEAEREKEAEESRGRKSASLPGAEGKTVAEQEAEIEEQIQREMALPVTRDAPIPGAKVTPWQKPYMLTLEQTVEIGFLCSREFQALREGLYLVALPVTSERFSFAAQPFMTEQLIRERAGRKSTDGETNHWLSNSTIGFGKLFSTGALLLVNFANQTVYNLGKTGKTFSQSTVSLDILQPFLRGGGKAVTLEPLTQAERNLLYAIRDFYRLRQEYFVFFAAGQPTFIPGVGAGVQAILPGTINTPGPAAPVSAPITVPLSVGTGGTALQVTPGNSAKVLTTAAFGPTPQGFLSTVGEKATLVNYYKNIQAFQRYFRLFQVYLEGGIVTATQVNQIEQNLLQFIFQVVTTFHVTYRISLDQLKQQLGLPMTVPLDVDMGPLEPVIRQTRRYEDLIADFEAASGAALSYGRPGEVGQVRERLRRLFTEAGLVRGTRFQNQILQRWKNWEDIPEPMPRELPTPLDRRMDEYRAERRRLLDKRAAAKDEKLSEADQRRLLDVEFELDLGQFERSLRYYESEPWKDEKNPLVRQGRQAQVYRYVHRNFLGIIEEGFRERLDQIRRNWPSLPPACVDGVDLIASGEEEALYAAERACLAYRLDLMNNRAQLVDSWRKIAVAANALLGTFSVDYHVDSITPFGTAQPFNFGHNRTRHELIFNGSPPLVRILERNIYRSTLITYQQQRRALMANEDQALFEVRLDLRQLRAQAYSYQAIQKRNIELAYVNVDQALQAFSQPQAPPGTSGELPGLVGPTAGRPVAGDPAALTQQLLNTQSSLLNAQNNLYSSWIGYLTGRMFLFRDLGAMPLDSRGVWIDASASCDCNAPASTPASQPDAGRGTGGPERLPEPEPTPAERLPAPRPEPAAEGEDVGPGR